MAVFGQYNNTSAPKMRWYADLSYTRISNSVVCVTVTVTGEIVNHVSGSWIGTGNDITVYATVNGSSQSSVIKASSASWYGNSNNPRSCSFSFDISSTSAGTSIPVSYSVSAAGYAAPAAVPTQSTTFATPAMLYVPSQISLTSVVNGAYTDTVRATITPQYSTFSHTVVYSCNGHMVTHNLAAGVTSDSLQIPASWIPNDPSASVTAVCTTYLGSTVIGSDNDYTTAIVPASVVPVISSVTRTRVNGAVPSAWGVYVQGKSAVKLTVNASGAQGSTIKSYKITGGGYTGTTNPYQTGVLNTAGSNTFSVIVTDSRGRQSATYTASVNVVAYEPPKISSVITKRCTSSGADDDEGTYATCLGVGTAASIDSKNVISRNLYYRRYGTQSWTPAGAWMSGTASIIGAGALSPDATYEVMYEIVDSFTTSNPVSRNDLLSSAHYLVDAYEDADGNQYFAVGKAAEQPNLIDLAHPFYDRITIEKYTVASNTFGDSNPKIVFRNGNHDLPQEASLTFTDYDSVQAPSSLTLNGNQGGEYFIAPNIKATSGMFVGGDSVPTVRYGTWTPSLPNGANQCVHTNQYGRWIKIGRIVWIYADVQISSVGSASIYEMKISGLPFWSALANVPLTEAFDNAKVPPHAAFVNGGTTMTLKFLYQNCKLATVYSCDVENNFRVCISGCYEATS